MTQHLTRASPRARSGPCALALLLAAGAGAADSWTAFRDPPADARPFVRWWWNGNAVTEPEIRRQIDVMHRAGIGGFEINPIAMPEFADGAPGEAMEWLSPGWIRMARTAVDAARAKGMIADLIVGSGWPFGGEFLREDQWSQRVTVRALELQGPARWQGRWMDLFPEDGPVRTIKDHLGRPVRILGLRKDRREDLLFLRLAPEAAADIREVRDVRAAVGADGTVTLDIPAGAHRLIAGVRLRGADSVHHGAKGASGPVLDHFNGAAIRDYLDRMAGALRPAFGGRIGDSVRAVFCDSIELYRANWTGDFLPEFRRRRGYDPDPWLPFAIEFVNPPDPGPALRDAVRRVRYDFCLTLTELFQERFVGTFHAWAREHGMLSRYQAYGHPWLMDMANGFLIPDIPESNNWLFSVPDTHGFPVWTKYASSGGHLAGRRTISTEAMTNTDGVFRTPLSMVKAADDANFIMGINHSVLHGFNYSPLDAGFPGWVRYGTFFSEHNTWWPWVRLWTDRNARLSAAFQSAAAAGDVAILAATADVWSAHGLERPPFHDAPRRAHQLWKGLHSNGVCADYVSEAVVRKARVADGRMAFGPMRYDLLIVAGAESLDAGTAEALAQMAESGLRIAWIAPLPSRAPGFQDAGARDERVRAAVRRAASPDCRPILPGDPPAMPELLDWTDALLTEAAVRRPIRFAKPRETLTQIRYREGGRDLFFVANLSDSEAVQVDAAFADGSRAPMIWDPDTGERAALPLSETGRWTAELGPQESRLIVCEPGVDRPTCFGGSPALSVVFELTGPWTAEFHPVRGAPFRRDEIKPGDLGADPDPALASFAGEIRYATTFTLPRALPRGAVLDLGRARDIAEAAIDGRPLGARWYGRPRFVLADGLERGEHTLDIRVATVLFNHMRTMTPSRTAMHWVAASPDTEPAPAGLIGPVRFLCAPGFAQTTRADEAAQSFDKTFFNQHRSEYSGRGFEWENNRIGISDKAPPPWTPVRVENGVVTVTHRSLHLGAPGGIPLIRQITSLGRPLLAGGLILRLVDGAGGVHHLTLDPEPAAACDAAVTFRGAAALPGGAARLECRIEFDGFVHLGLDLHPAAGTTLAIQDLRLSTEFHREAVSHYRYFAAYNFTTEQLDEGGRRRSTGLVDRPMTMPFTPLLWLGTPELGLEWMCETDHGWSHNDPAEAIHIQPSAGHVTCIQQIINRPVVLSASRHIALAFAIMPTRPAPFAGWNADSILVNSHPVLDYRAGLAPWHKVYGVHRNTAAQPGRPRPRGETLSTDLRHFGLSTPHASGPEARRYQRERAQLREKDIRYLPYSILHGLPTDLPGEEVRVDRQYLDHWDLRTSKQGHTHYFYICLQHKSAIDFQLYYAIKTIREHKLDGQYFDLAQPRVASGYALRHTGDIDHDTFYMPIFGYREFSKRYYAAAMELNPEFLIIQHAVIPTSVSSTYALSSGGEHLKQYFGEGGKTHFIDADGITRLAMDVDAYDPDYFKIPDMMYPVGNWFPVFGQCLSFSDILKGAGAYFREHPERSIYFSRTFLARSLVHGVPIWIRSLHQEETLKIFQALDRYGPRSETRAVHGALDPKVHLLNDDTAPLEYRIERKPGRLLLLASNRAMETLTARFDLGPLLDTTDVWSFVNAEDGTPVPHENGRFDIPITRRDFRVVVGTGVPPPP